jgi:1,4-dihydroxy-2-naphthoate octaprenyltransferase
MFKWLYCWARFFELRIPDGSFPALIGVTLAWTPGAGGEFWLRGGLIYLYFLLLLLFIHGAEAIVGYIRGVDRLVYEQGGVVKEPKLLVTEEVSLHEAFFMTGLIAFGVICLLIYFAFTMDRLPFLMTVLLTLFAGQYSIGLSLSYRGLGEAVIFSTGLETPIAYIALTGRVEFGPFLVGAVLGFFFAGVNLNSNHADYPYDHAAGRGTLAVRVGLAAHRQIGVVLFILCWTCCLTALLTAALPPYAGVLLLLVPRHVRQLRMLFAGEAIKARRLGFISLRMMFAMVFMAIFLHDVMANHCVDKGSERYASTVFIDS